MNSLVAFVAKSIVVYIHMILFANSFTNSYVPFIVKYVVIVLRIPL